MKISAHFITVEIDNIKISTNCYWHVDTIIKFWNAMELISEFYN